MFNTMLAALSDNSPPGQRSPMLQTILTGGLVVGVLDGLDALIFNYALRGTPPVRIFQFIASGVLGADAFNGGWKSGMLGVLLHFLIAFILTAIYYGASLRLPALIRRVVICGLVYGVAVYFVMNYAVLPMAGFRQGTFFLPSFLNGVLIHAFGVGLPIALIVRRFSQPSSHAGL